MLAFVYYLLIDLGGVALAVAGAYLVAARLGWSVVWGRGR